MPTKTKEQLAADILAEHKAPKASAAQKEQARKARNGAKLARESGTKKKTVTTPTRASAAPARNATGNLSGIGGVSFAASDYMTGDIWVPDERIPAIDEATYEGRKTKAEGQKRSIEVASLNLSNIQGLHKLEGQTIDIAIAAQTNQTRYAKLEGAELDYRTQVEVNGAKSQKLTQATEANQFASRETGYLSQQIGLKDENFNLEIEQARRLLGEKTQRFQTALAGQ